MEKILNKQLTGGDTPNMNDRMNGITTEKPATKNKFIQVPLSPSDHRKLKKHCKANGLKMQFVARQAIMDRLNSGR